MTKTIKQDLGELLSDLRDQNPNNFDLGRKYREYIIKSTGTVDDLCKVYPNDYDLGTEIRKIKSK
jgi:hypothetical protein